MKKLECDRGFLNHVGMCYDIIIPYIRGYHNTIDGWRNNRNAEGWKMEDGTSQWREILDYYVCTGKISSEKMGTLLDSQDDPAQPLKLVLPAPRLFDDLLMLENIFL